MSVLRRLLQAEQPYEERVELAHPYAAVFEGAQRCCDRLRSAVMLSADASTGRVVVAMRSTAWAWGATLVVDVGSAEAHRSKVRVWATSAFVVDFRPLLRFHVRRYLKALTEYLRTNDTSVRQP